MPLHRNREKEKEEVGGAGLLQGSFVAAYEPGNCLLCENG